MEISYLFAGERRSTDAIARGWTWKDGIGSTAGHLFKALRACGIDPSQQQYVNVFRESGGIGPEIISDKNMDIILAFAAQAFIVVGMGQKVHRALTTRNIEHREIWHPAALGEKRKLENYVQNIKDQLEL